MEIPKKKKSKQILNQNTGIRNAWKQDWYQISHWQCQIQEDKEVIAQKSWEPWTLNLCTNKLTCLRGQNLNNLRQLKNSVYYQTSSERVPLLCISAKKKKEEFIRKKWDLNNNVEQIKQ